ncbi:nitrous oxide reductase family maturation protein NosD [Prosthecobacter sp.]|uniref:nitrous oxide reductase family maturation protein NosD n=1 Tax=Prosthecobacter sp. TaxID=1965333 RepID=UPI003784DCA8
MIFSAIRNSAFTIALLACTPATSSAADLSVANYKSIQEALKANPNRMVFVPAGDYPITEKIRIRGDRSGLFGPGRIIQQSADQPIIEIENANGAEVRDLTLTRPEGKMESRNEGIIAIKCRDLVVENVRVIDNRSPAGAITVRESKDTRISRCVVRNYMRVSIDDRTGNKELGYAFNCTDGTGISVSYSTGTLIEGNRVIEDNFVPTPEVKTKFKLGDFVKKNAEKGAIINQQMWDANYTDAWQQGSGIIVTAPEISDLTRVIGNHIENAGQGLDIHSDHVIVSQNIITNAFIGMKAMHGSRNVLITGNQFVRNSLWAIGLMPGAAAHPATADKPENSDGGSIISNNIISDFGYGDAHWIWGDERSPIKFDDGQQPDDPPLTDVIISGNFIHCSGKPRYKYAVVIPGGTNSPRGLHFSNNLFHPGTQGVCNIELPQ